MKTKQTKAQRIAELERQLHEAKAAQVHNYHFASTGLDKLSTDRLMGSGVILSMTVLGGHTTFKPVLIRDGLSKETIAAIKADLVRSYKLAVELKPEGA
jgi:hypothetical protein